MIKDILLNSINLSQQQLTDKNKNILSKTKDNFDKYYSRTQINYMKIKNLKLVESLIQDMKFIDETNKVEEYLSDYGTFCTREEFYYTTDILSRTSDEIYQICMCELFNAFQLPRTSVSDITLNKMVNETVLMLYSIGIIKEKLRYGVKNRIKSLDKINTENYIIFKPNKNAVKCNYKRHIKDDTLNHYYAKEHGIELHQKYIERDKVSF